MGINDWQGLSRKIKDHEYSRSHLAACVAYDTWKTDHTIDKELHCVTLASCNLAFRGHREKIGEINNGNFLSVIELLARYDPVLKDLLERKSTLNYLTHTIKNELIALLSQKVKEEIVTEIKQAEFYSVIMDTTQDITKVDQLSEVFRYVTVETVEKEQPTEVKINESFLGFQSVKDQSASGIEKQITGLIESLGISVNKCRGQGYDGASTMSGAYSGVQKRISDRAPNAVYVHCAAHNLNLVLNDACQKIPEIRAYYDTVQRIYVFFSESINRWKLLENHLSKPTLKRLCPTRWASRYDAIKSLRFRYKEVMQALSKIIMLSKKPEERTEASGIQKAMETFEFVLMTVVQLKLLETVNAASQALQKQDMDLLHAASLLRNAMDTLT